VTVTPLFMVTSSPAPGTEKPPQVTVLFQFPETEAVLGDACAGTTGEAASASITIISANDNFEIHCLFILHLL
jgi:hypothetical protein